MSILKQKALGNKVERKTEKKLPPVGAWGNYKSNRPRVSECERERKLLVDVSDLTLAYEGRTVISDLSFQVHSGDYVCIIGENGSGKTTLLNALLGLKKPSGGKIELCDLNRSEIGVLPQKTPVQNDFPALVSEIVLSGRVGKKFGAAFYNRQDKRIAFENMEKLGITSIAKQSFRTLSGGQQQRALLARALCAAEKLMVLDEPAASLDPKACADMYHLISDINKGENMAVIMVSHDIDHALEYASHILQINKRSVFFGTTEEYRREFGQHICTCKTDCENTSYGDSDAYKFKGGETNA